MHCGSISRAASAAASAAVPCQHDTRRLIQFFRNLLRRPTHSALRKRISELTSTRVSTGVLSLSVIYGENCLVSSCVLP
jgi:hypothetical protein